MKKLMAVFVLAGLSIGFGFSDKGLILPGAYGEWSCLGIQDGRVYIFTGETFHVFDLKDGKPLKTFGRIGQGPGEYKKYFAFPFYTPHGIVITNQGKCIKYSLDGEYLDSTISEKFYVKLLPLDSGYVGQRESVIPGSKENDSIVSLLDEKFKPVRELYREGYNALLIEKDGTFHYTFPSAAVDIAADGDHIYIGNPAEVISFSLLNKQGELIRTIRRDVRKIAVSEKDRKEFLRSADTKSLAPGVTMKTDVKVEAFYPAFHFFKVDRGLIYVFTYRMKDGKREVIVLDEKGNDIATVSLPKAAAMDSCVFNNKFYYVVYDENIDELVLHAEDILEK
ncbi:MAG: hypothetical protein JW843_08085 [Candidatus Aminicenantes bacterium]|nr:hypothetical protein [Candidatus Aminicenantes bacterium]